LPPLGAASDPAMDAAMEQVRAFSQGQLST
jgi:hypothetical protein